MLHVKPVFNAPRIATKNNILAANGTALLTRNQLSRSRDYAQVRYNCHTCPQRIITT